MDLVQVLQKLPRFTHPWLGHETGAMDDAALLHVGEGELVFTLDVITPIVDDAEAFGRIAAANALSDVYAMGGTPQVALSFAGLPGSLGLEIFEQVLRGMADKAKEAECAIVGGHTIKDSEPKCGLVVLGSVAKDQVWTHKGARPGLSLVLTKAIGTGVLAQALRAGVLEESQMAEAVASMETLNREACALGRSHGAVAATDVTGFGLLGHLHHMVAAGQCAARLHTGQVPLLAGALDVARAGHVPGGSKRNAQYVEDHLRGASDIDPTLLLLMADAQTSGGLLMAIPHDDAKRAVDAFDGAHIIGETFDGEAGVIELR